MPTPYDPARAYADLCESLRGKSSDRTWAEVLSDTFGVVPWSPDFFEIVACIIRQAIELKDIVVRTDMDDDLKDTAYQHIDSTLNSFHSTATGQPWKWACSNFLDSSNTIPIKLLSSSVRAVAPIVRLSDDEVAELIYEIDQLIALLEEHELSEADFIRGMLLDALKRFRFRTERLWFVGWAYALDAVREIIGAYYALERGTTAGTDNPPAELVLRSVKSLLNKVWDTVKTTKETAESTGWLVRLYAASSIYVHGKSDIGGLLQHLV